MSRLDVALVEWGLAPSRSKAQSLIEAGEVEIQRDHINWQPCTDQSLEVGHLSPENVRICDDAKTLKYVSRGGLKLEFAIDHLKLSVEGWRCLDIGQSTGGFTDLLLSRGAKHVLGADVGTGQLHDNIRADARVTSLEKTHIKDLFKRALVREWLDQGLQLCVVDLSFISLTKVFSLLANNITSGTHMLVLVKPQFEVGRQGLDKNGIVKDPKLLEDVQERITQSAEKCGFTALEYFACAIKGQDGNQEFFLWARRN